MPDLKPFLPPGVLLPWDTADHIAHEERARLTDALAARDDAWRQELARERGRAPERAAAVVLAAKPSANRNDLAEMIRALIQEVRR